MDESIRLGRVRGIPVGLHWSVLAIAALLTFGLATGWFPERVPDGSRTTWVVAAVATALAFFASLLAHELAHAIVAQRHGITVEGITLWLLGGVSRLRDDYDDPVIELRVALAGPLTSIALAAGFAAAWLGMRAHGLDLLREVALWLAMINAVLGVFNLVPAFPLDGGRVYRSVLWRRTGDRTGATRKAAVAGRRFGHGLVAIGILEVLLTGALDGLWLVLLGMFVVQAARQEEQGLLLRTGLGGLRVADVMTRDPVTAPDWLTVDRFVDDVVGAARVSAYPLTDLGGEVTGLVTLRQLAPVPAAIRADTRVREVATPIVAVPVARPDEPALDLFERLQAVPGARALVFDGGALVGIVSTTDLTRSLDLALLRQGNAA